MTTHHRMPRACAAVLACVLWAADAGATLAPSIVPPTLSNMTQQRSSTNDDLRGKSRVSFTGQVAPAWTARSDVTWLVIDTPTGTGPAPLRYHVDPRAAAAQIVNWDSAVATITVSATGLSSVQSSMTFRRQLPEITMLTPAQVLPGQPATLTLSGKGLSQVDAISEIFVGDVAVSTGTIVSDTQATVDLTPQAAGALQVRVANGTNVTTAQAQVAITELHAYSSTPTVSGTSKTSMLYDPSRQAVFASDYYGNALDRWRFNGSKWVLKVVPWAGAWRVSMSPDRRTLYVLGTAGLSEVDPDTLAVRVTHPEMTGFQGFYFNIPLIVTNDLRLWGPQGTQYLDLRHGTFRNAGAEFGNVGADDLVGTPDGAHIYSTEGYYQPAPPNGWWSSAGHSTKPLPGSLLNFNYFASFDEHGKKGVFSGMSVYKTADWSLVGDLPAGNYPNAVMSPDGRRVYALTYGSGWPSHATQVSVYDTLHLQSGTTTLALVGTIPVANPAAVCGGEYECDSQGRFAIDATGSELFWAGNAAFTVIPIPANLR